MYTNQNAAYAENTPTPVEIPFTQSAGEEFVINNNNHAENISAIENKLHQLLNLRTPGKEEQNPVPNISDFYSHIQQQLGIMRENNYRLQKILDHLNKIV